MSKIDTQTETKIVAMIARGDSYSEIQTILLKDGISITGAGISGIKDRNLEALSYIQRELARHEVSKTTRILDKTRNMIDKKLDGAVNLEQDLAHIRDLRESGEIDDIEYGHLFNKLIRDANISIKDLTTVSKEMFTQSQIEAGKPTSIVENPEQAKKNLNTLLRAIKDGKEEDMVGAIFLDA